MATTESRDVLRQVANAVLIPAAIAVNFLPRIFEYDVGVVARQNEPLLAAAGWAFSIWGLIFLGQLVYAVYQALPSQRANPALRRVGFFTALACLGGGLWTVFFLSKHFAAAWVTMLVILTSLIFVELRLGNMVRRGREFWLIRLPFAVNLGWISVATILNSAQFFKALGWNGAPLTPLMWSIILVGVATALSLVMGFFRRNLAFAAIISWGLMAIATYRLEDAPSLAMAAFAGAGMAAALVVAAAIAMLTGKLSVNVPGAAEG